MNLNLRTVLASAALSLTALAGNPDGSAPAGQPVPGLTADELARFQDGRALYQHDFTPQEGVGPLFNERACSTCHGAPDVGGFDPAGTTNNVTHFTLTTPEGGQIFQAFELGGPVIQKKSFVTEGMPEAASCPLPPDTLPTMVHGIGTSLRHTPAVFGFGLLDAVPDAEILEYQGKKPWKRPGVIGVPNWGVELQGLGKLIAFHLDGTRTQVTGPARIGRFGWKAQVPTLFQFSTEPFNTELGISTPFFPRENHPFGDRLPPGCLVANAQPNDVKSQNSLRLYYFQALLAAPEPARKTPKAYVGEVIFKIIGCADCHRETLHTGDYYLPLPDGTPHKVAALSNKTIQPYSDLLVHDMGDGLADVRPMGRASGRFWRTTPLWGLRHQTRFLHDGSATSIDEAIDRHGGESTFSQRAYERLSAAEEDALLEFLKTL